jgi:hypothetical protein
MTASLACGACRTPIAPERLSMDAPLACEACGALHLGEVFPAFHRELPAAAPGEDVDAAGEATCFTHTGKRAVGACGRCGAFVCRLCDLPVAGERLCPRCLDTGVAKRTIPRLETGRLLHGRIALSLSTLPLLLFYFTLLTAPAAIFVAIRYWKAPQSLVRPSRAGHVVAIVLGLTQLVGWAFLVSMLFRMLTEARGG